MKKPSNDAALRAQKNMPEQMLLNLPLAEGETGETETIGRDGPMEHGKEKTV